MNAKEIEDAIHELQLVIFGTTDSPTPAGLKRKAKLAEAKVQAAQIEAESKAKKDK